MAADFQGVAVEFVDGAGDQEGDTQVFEKDRSHYARLYVGAYGHNSHVEVLYSKLLEDANRPPIKEARVLDAAKIVHISRNSHHTSSF